MSRVIATARRDLDWLALIWGDIMAARLKGTPRTWLHHSTTTSPEVVPGDEQHTVAGMPAPLHLDVLDAIVDVVAWADETAEAVSQVLGLDRLAHASSSFADPRPHLAHIGRNLADLFADERDYAEALAGEAAQRARAAERLLGMNRFGQTLNCDCPYCGLPNVLTVVVPEGADPLMVCMGNCWMDDDHTGHATWRGRRAWAHPDGWVQLAKVLETAA